jgi:phosphopantothenoylcysteine decarboxylase/phosphopantothenate--cysteine ligase
MRDAVVSLAPQHDVLVMAAAVADYAPSEQRSDKIKRDGSALRLDLVPNADIVAEVGHLPAGERPFVVGFAAETRDLAENARAKLRAKRLDLVVGNRVDGPEGAIGSDAGRVTVFAGEGEVATWPLLPKRQVAERLWDLITDRYRGTSAGISAADVSATSSGKGG